jgi:hypothetical protein
MCHRLDHEQMVTQSQYLTAAGELQQAFFPAGIEYQITASSSPAFFGLATGADSRVYDCTRCAGSVLPATILIVDGRLSVAFAFVSFRLA